MTCSLLRVNDFKILLLVGVVSSLIRFMHVEIDTWFATMRVLFFFTKNFAKPTWRFQQL